MINEERYTFSSLTSALIDCEDKIQALYRAAVHQAGDTNNGHLLSECKENSLRRIEGLRQARAERVIEIALEPITGLELEGLIRKLTEIAIDTHLDNIEKIVRAEEILSELYARSIHGISRMSSDTSEMLMELSKESVWNLRKLELRRPTS